MLPIEPEAKRARLDEAQGTSSNSNEVTLEPVPAGGVADGPNPFLPELPNGPYLEQNPFYEGLHGLNKDLVSSIESSLARAPDPILKGETINALQTHIINQLDIIFHQKGIKIPDGWTTYRLLKHVIVNNKDLFRDTDFLCDLIDDLAYSKNPCWLEPFAE